MVSLFPGYEYRFVVFLTFFLTMLVSILITRHGGKMPFVRHIQGMDALGELVGRAAEMGRPICVTFGIQGGFVKQGAEQSLAALSILGYIARLCARTGARLVTGVSDATIYNLVLQNVTQGYLVEGKPEMMTLSDHEYLPEYSYDSGICDLQDRYQIASMCQIGCITHESTIISENAAKYNAMQLGGTAGVGGEMAFMAATCDYQLLGEELYVGGAYVSNNLTEIGAILGSDYNKFIFAAVSALILILYNLGVKLPAF